MPSLLLTFYETLGGLTHPGLSFLPTIIAMEVQRKVCFMHGNKDRRFLSHRDVGFHVSKAVHYKASDGGGLIRNTYWLLSPCLVRQALANSSLSPAVTADKGQQRALQREHRWQQPFR